MTPDEAMAEAATHIRNILDGIIPKDGDPRWVLGTLAILLYAISEDTTDPAMARHHFDDLVDGMVAGEHLK